MLENIRLSLQGILSHKVRSILTMLGIIIGIAAIIAIVSTIKGTNEQIKNNLIGAGNNTVSVQLYQGDSPYDFTYQSAPDGGHLPGSAGQHRRTGQCGIGILLPHTFLLQQRILSEHPVQRRHVRHRCQIL